jgi:hypothetical protein
MTSGPLADAAGPPPATFAELVAPFGGRAGGPGLGRAGTGRRAPGDRAWGAAGLAAAEIQALAAGPERAAIESETNRRAGIPYARLDPGERLRLLADLAALPGQGRD